YNLLEDVFDQQTKEIRLNHDDEVHRGCVVLDGGKLLWPPPTRPKPRAAAPLPEGEKAPPSAAAAHGAVRPPSRAGLLLGALAAVVLCAAGLFAGTDFLEPLSVFLLACVVGWHVIWNVNPALHTPLMSVTNAISGIILVGGILLMRSGGLGPATILAAAAIL